MTGPLRRVSVVLPAKDAVPHVEAQLGALAGQHCCLPWEVVVADNGSTDGTPDVVRRWTGQVPGLRVVDASAEPSSWAARGLAASVASGDALLFCDADDVVGGSWVSAHVEALTSSGLATGPVDTRRLNAPAARETGPPASWRSSPPVGNGYLPFALGANLAVRRSVFEDVGGFDPRPHGGDKVFSWRAQLAGHRLHFAPDAVVHYRLREDTGSTWRRQLKIGRSAPSLYRLFREQGMPRSSAREALREWGWLVAAPPTLWSAERRLRYARTAGRRVGRLRGSLEERTLYL